ncbi:uncharacterized protein LOC8080735 isoform X3 [Sorghum bicolor]|uniref:uncharacterized protein LOC8080735 isoform X3 n=1 Tax=Sorghum bicolor TaxID=4558 RepID=UPI000B4261D9|nr:uncharacterized protein LOC8080735 isoform X3 [Sorghum bicolor]|eukprot:XP_021309766.1 uncharacterized protein LOC8080735 isoform X3 [Sorghum bicolor]
MEHVMKASLGRQGQANGDVVDELDDAVRTVEPRLQLALRRLRQRRHRPVTKSKQDPVPHQEDDRTVAAVVGALLYSLGLLQAMSNVVDELRTLGQGLCHSRHTSCSLFVGAQGGRVAPVHNAERRLPQRRLKGGVEDIFRPRQPAQPVAWPVTCQTAKVHYNDLVSGLRLPVGLWVERRRHLQLCAAQTQQLPLEVGGEHRVTVGDDGLRDAVQPHDVGEESLGHCLGRVWVRQGQEVGVLAEAVDDRQDDGLALDTRQRLDEVHGDVRPNTLRNRKGQQQARRVQLLRLVALAHRTRADEVLHHPFHVRKMKIPAETMQGALNAFMSFFVDSQQDFLQQRGARW